MTKSEESKVKLAIIDSIGQTLTITTTPKLAAQLYPEETVELYMALGKELAKNGKLESHGEVLPKKMKKKYRPQLIRCPVCAGRAHYTTEIDTEHWSHPTRFWDVECKSCGKSNAALFVTPAEAASEWNYGPCPAS